MPNAVRVIPATLARFSSRPIAETKKRRVAAYARVSTDEDEQLTSYEAQVGYYTSYIQSRDDWEFVEVYADEGISGTHTERRDGFNRMVNDAIHGRKIDLIITKSVSRFARNTVDSLTTVRELKDRGVEVYFEKENIWTFDSKCEMLLAIMSSIAQEESRSISENVLWGVHKRFEEGKFSVGYGAFLGYDKGPDGKLVVNKEQAETVRYIFRRFLEGRTPYSISKELMERGMLTGTGNPKWTSEGVVRILKNEKYSGNAILQKTYKRHHLAKREANNGEVRKFFVEGSHEAIITPEQYDMAQLELQERSKGLRQHSSKSIFSGKIICGCCGHEFGAKVWHSTDKYRTVIWRCNDKFSNEEKCTTPHLKDETIRQIFLVALNQLITDKEPALEMMRAIKSKLEDNAALQKKLAEAETDLDIVSRAFLDYVNGTQITEADIEGGKYEEYGKKINAAKELSERLRDQIADRNRRAASIGRFIHEVEGYDELFSEFTEELWLGLADSITVKAKGEYVVKFRSGLEIPVIG